METVAVEELLMEEDKERDVAEKKAEEEPLFTISGHIYTNGHNRKGQHTQLLPLSSLGEMGMLRAVIYVFVGF